MKISVVIPTRNRVHALEKCIESLRNQTSPPEEVVIIGCTNDLTERSFVEKLPNNTEIKYIRTDAGSCKNRNIGISHAKGDILVFLDDDIILDRNYIKNTRNIFKNNKIDIIGGYTFDIVDLTTPWLIRRGEIEYILNHSEDEFIKTLLKEVSNRFPDKLTLSENKLRLEIYFLARSVRNFLKYIILQEWPIKGKILLSGYRSEMPVITNINGLKKVEWVQGGNFAVRKRILNNFKFNENFELFNYALGEDLEFSARVGKLYDIFVSSDMRLIHLRYPGGRIDERQKFKSMVVNFYRVSLLRGNTIANLWSVTGLIISRIAKIPLTRSIAINEINGIIDGIKYLKYSKEFNNP